MLLFPMPQIYDMHDETIVLNGVDDPVLPLANPVGLPPCQLQGPRRTRVVCQCRDARYNLLTLFFLGDVLDLFGNGAGENDVIFCHVL